MSVRITVSNGVVGWLRRLEQRPHLYQWEYVASQEINSILQAFRSYIGTAREENGATVMPVDVMRIEYFDDCNIDEHVFSYRDQSVRVRLEKGRLRPYEHYLIMFPDENLEEQTIEAPRDIAGIAREGG